MEGLEQICFQLITSAGSAKSCYIEAIQKAKQGDFDEAKAKIKEGDSMLLEAHEPHTDMIQKEAAGETTPLSLFLIHAEDQMMSTEIFKVMAEEFISLYEEREEWKKN
jgi:PTS system cellobiose-specific IIA component